MHMVMDTVLCSSEYGRPLELPNNIDSEWLTSEVHSHEPHGSEDNPIPDFLSKGPFDIKIIASL